MLCFHITDTHVLNDRVS